METGPARLSHSGPLAGRQPVIARAFATTMLGGVSRHDGELGAALPTTLAHLKRVAEA